MYHTSLCRRRCCTFFLICKIRFKWSPISKILQQNEQQNDIIIYIWFTQWNCWTRNSILSLLKTGKSRKMKKPCKIVKSHFIVFHCDLSPDGQFLQEISIVHYRLYKRHVLEYVRVVELCWRVFLIWVLLLGMLSDFLYSF